jgi:ribose-phosphate pyrophosphokinase
MTRAPILLPLPGNDDMAHELAHALGADLGQIQLHSFPDGESYVRLLSEVSGRDVALVCTLDRPDRKLLPLLFAAATARELGATRIGLVAPYLAYMRQDKRFKSGEAVTSRQVAGLLSSAVDWLVTVDPHLHRYGSLAPLYSCRTQVLHAAPLISEWIKSHVESPVVIGPDSESEQWVAAVAHDAGATYAVLQKQRHGDRDVDITLSAPIDLAGKTPVLVDDIISSGRTMVAAAQLLAKRSGKPPVCVAVHGIFADDADKLLAQAGATVVTCNTIRHASNGIDVRSLVAAGINELLQITPATARPIIENFGGAP